MSDFADDCFFTGIGHLGLGLRWVLRGINDFTMVAPKWSSQKGPQLRPGVLVQYRQFSGGCWTFGLTNCSKAPHVARPVVNREQLGCYSEMCDLTLVSFLALVRVDG